jgi:methylenetetrahydrofolate dehydrogenase (NADP+)/methenyltetrahydrofolate cyclohydrolase
MKALDGKAPAADIRAGVATAAAEFAAKHGAPPTLAVVVANDDDGSAWYVRTLLRTAEKSGLGTRLVDLGATAAEDEILTALEQLGADPTVHGIILQTPLPAGTGLDRLARAIPVGKDVDGVNPVSAGHLVAGLPAFAPATAAAVLELLARYEVPLIGARAVVIGRSLVVGKPAALLLLAEHATVTIAHSRTRDLPAVAREADILIAAIGRPGMVTAEFVKPGAVVIDVGTTPDAAGQLRGDVDAASVAEVAGALTPVPGGVGPVTTALLLRHTVRAAEAYAAGAGTATSSSV